MSETRPLAYSIQLKTWTYDGGIDVHGAFALSGEPIAPQVQKTYGNKPLEPVRASDISAVNVAKREWQKDYMEYWNSTTDLTGTGRPVDGFISPLAPFPAARPTKYSYYGYSTIINSLDYTSVVIPVTTVDKNVDAVDKSYKPLNDNDREVYEDCK